MQQEFCQICFNKQCHIQKLRTWQPQLWLCNDWTVYHQQWLWYCSLGQWLHWEGIPASWPEVISRHCWNNFQLKSMIPNHQAVNVYPVTSGNDCKQLQQQATCLHMECLKAQQIKNVTDNCFLISLSPCIASWSPCAFLLLAGKQSTWKRPHADSAWIETLLPLSCMPVKSSRFIQSSTPSGTCGRRHLCIGVGKMPKQKRFLGLYLRNEHFISFVADA